MVRYMPVTPRSRAGLPKQAELYMLEIETLKSELRGTKTRLLRYEQTAPVSDHTTSPTTTPSFMKSTVSSRRRLENTSTDQAKDQTKEIFLINGRRNQYTDGVLTACDTSTHMRGDWIPSKEPRYRRGTESSYRKIVRTKKQRWEVVQPYAITADHIPGSPWSHSDSGTICTPALVEQEPTPHSSPPKSSCDIQAALEAYSQLQISKGETIICSETAHKLLTRSHRLAQETFYFAAKQRYPKIWRVIEDSPREVMFGRGELDDILGSELHRLESSPVESWDARNELIGALYNMVHLRNDLSHWRGRWGNTLSYHDSMMVKAHKLILILGDTPRASMMQGLRMELLQAADDALRRLDLATLPFSNDLEDI